MQVEVIGAARVTVDDTEAFFDNKNGTCDGIQFMFSINYSFGQFCPWTFEFRVLVFMVQWLLETLGRILVALK